MSMKPGSTVACARSTTVSPLPAGGEAVVDRRDAVALDDDGHAFARRALTPSTRRPAWTSVAAAAAPAGRNAARAAKRIAGRMRTSERDYWSSVSVTVSTASSSTSKSSVAFGGITRCRRRGRRRRAGRDHEAAHSADLHAGHTLLPTADHAAGAERKAQRLAAITRAVELAAALVLRRRVVEPARVVDDHDHARQRLFAEPGTRSVTSTAARPRGAGRRGPRRWAWAGPRLARRCKTVAARLRGLRARGGPVSGCIRCHQQR